MVDMTAITSAAGALKVAYDLSKAAISAHDAAAIRAKVAEMQGEISSALASAIAAQTDQMVMLKRVSDLGKEIADLKACEAEKQRYEPKRFDPGVLVYSLKEHASGVEPPHEICPACYENGKKHYLQATARTYAGRTVRVCSGCKHEFAFGPAGSRARDSARHRSDYDPFANI